ncbi:MAG: hypothetical protein MUC87_21965 [Bacteroidia bacterium]|jgi:hypothetical protein|nr:hypothetical protein [Bacteroidia bacterium]
MKTLFLSVFLLISVAVFSQNALQPGRSYVLNASVVATPWDYLSNTAQSAASPMSLERGYKYTLLSVTPDNQYAIIELWRFVPPQNRMLRSSTNDQKAKDRFSLSGKPLNDFRYFRIQLADLSSKSTAYSGRTPVIGLLTLPVKLRFGYNRPNTEFDFSKDVSLAASFAVRTPLNHGLNESYFTWVFATGFSSISLDSLTAPQSGKSIDASSYTLALGAMFEFKSGQIGLFSGIDLLGRNKERYGWVYQGLPWFSIGIGVNLFSANNDSPGSKEQTVLPGGSN